MALVNMNEMLAKAKQGGYAVGNFDTFNGDMLRGVMQAAEEKKAPLILAYAEAFEPLSPMDIFIHWMRAEAEAAGVPIAIHLDHGRSFDYVKKAVDCGFTSVMIDASDKSFEDNVAATKKVVDLCKPLNISVEAELGHVGGLEGFEYDAMETSEDDGYTVVEEAARFVAETGVDCLAVSIGTVHGAYKAEPKLNFDRLKELKAAVNVPLVMHGGSGLSDDDFRNVIKFGITKTNIFTDLTVKAIEASRAYPEADYFGMSTAAVEAVKNETIVKIDLFGTAGKA